MLTSAFHAVGFGYGRTDHQFTEADWTVLDGPGVDAYGKSKAIAERAAWDFVATDGGSLELATINPVAVLGPVLGRGCLRVHRDRPSNSRWAIPGYPDLCVPIVDVRDVASAHVLAMTTPEATGQRFIVTSESGFKMKEIGVLLKESVGERGKRVPSRSIPNAVVRIAAIFDKTARQIVPDLGITKQISNERPAACWDGSRQRRPRGPSIATAPSLITMGLVKA